MLQVAHLAQGEPEDMRGQPGFTKGWRGGETWNRKRILIQNPLQVYKKKLIPAKPQKHLWTWPKFFLQVVFTLFNPNLKLQSLFW